MKLHYTLLCVLFFCLSFSAFSQTQKDTIYAVKSVVPLVIDGSDADAVWAKMDWRTISNVWMGPKPMAVGDFEGKYKVAWDGSYLYVLVHVVDNVLSDDHSNPLQNWWDDDCVEVFIDENRSKGDHWKNNNAFAYHVSTFYDAVDLNSSGNGVNYKNNLKVVMDTIAPNTYLWEMAIKIYSASFSISNPEASRVELTAKKLMGFTLAYCDNDQTSSRENFIGSMTMPTTEDVNYKTADYFGSLLLVDQLSATSALTLKEQGESLFDVFPNPATNFLQLAKRNKYSGEIKVQIYSTTGAVIQNLVFENKNQMIDVSGLNKGIYFLKINSGSHSQIEKFIKK
jgi:hypothetical protein